MKKQVQIAVGLIIIFSFFNYKTIAQTTIPKPSACVNMDFSMGNFTNWVGHTSVYPSTTPGTNIPDSIYYYDTGIVNGRQTIITADTLDPFTCDNVHTIPLGEKFAARLGNGGTGSWGEGAKWQRDFLSYTFKVTSSNSLLSYKYAAVLQDVNPATAPIDGIGHAAPIRPRFIVGIKNTATNVLIDSVCNFLQENTFWGIKGCTYPQIEAAGGIAPQGSKTGTVYTDWTTVGVDLRAYIGQTITVQFETWDCGLGSHFGYAYITARCDSFAITQGCSANGGVVLTAPAGFKYKWIPSNDTTQSIEVKNAKPGDQIEVVLSNRNGCSSNLTIKVYPTFTKAAFSYLSNICVNSTVTYKDSSRSYSTKDTSSIPIISWLWDFGDGSTSILQNPVHIYTKAGIYETRLIAINWEGCSDTIRHLVRVYQKPEILDSKLICLGDSVQINLDTFLKSALWYNGDTSFSVWIKQAGKYGVMLTDTFNCITPDTVTVTTNQKAKITQSADILTASVGVDYQWFKDNNLIVGATAQIYEATESGTYFVKVTDSNLCLSNSDTIVFTLNSVMELSSQSGFNVHPNPGSGLFTFEFKEKINSIATIELHTLTGQKVGAFKLGQELQHTIDLENYPDGIYTVHISYLDKVWTQKLVKIVN